MCYQKFHKCRYCNDLYPCEDDNYKCPTINHDVNQDMCPSCIQKLERKIRELGYIPNLDSLTPKDILEK